MQAMRRMVLVAGISLVFNGGVARGAPRQATAETANRPVSLTDYTLDQLVRRTGPVPIRHLRDRAGS